MDKVIAIVVILGWMAIGWVVVDYNLGLGSTTLRWTNPAHPTAAWTWDARETTPTILEENSGQWLRVTLPRGFSRGTIRIATKEAHVLVVKAEPQDSQQAITSTTNGQMHTLSFSFIHLVARSRTFRFRLENPTTTAMTLSTISLTVTR